DECATGFCADGWCCNAACAGGCDRCDLAGSAGTCTVAPRGTAASGPPCTPYLCDGASASCPSSCAVDGDCEPGFTCQGGACAGGARGNCCNANHQCQLQLPGGAMATGGAGSCKGGATDGSGRYCCDIPCTDACEDCYSNGVCTVYDAYLKEACGGGRYI